jgi:hypothetical protein
MDNKILAYGLLKATEKNRDLIADHLNKSHAPNASELCTGKLDMSGAVSAMDKAAAGGSFSDVIGEVLSEHTKTVKVNGSSRTLAVDLSQGYLMNLAMVRLLNHNIKQEKSVIDNFRPA